MSIQCISEWEPCLQFPALKNNEVHLWFTHLDTNLPRYDYFTGLLSEAETNRADNYKVEKIAQNFVIARGLLREALGQYLDKNPREISLLFNENGKLFVSEAIHFSLSHSNDYILLVFFQHQIGIDIQHKREAIDFDDISVRFFSKCEADRVLSAKGVEKINEFYEIWVQKEAYTKLTGEKLYEVLHHYKLNNLHIKKATDCYFQNIFLNKNQRFPLNNDYAAMLATKMKPAGFRCWNVEYGQLVQGLS